MASTAAPAGGSRNGAGPEWGGFEENMQVMASRLRQPQPLGWQSPGSVVRTLLRGLEVCSICSTSPLLWLFVHAKVSETRADLKGPNLRSSQKASGLWAHSLFFSGQFRRSGMVGAERVLALAKTILCAVSFGGWERQRK